MSDDQFEELMRELEEAEDDDIDLDDYIEESSEQESTSFLQLLREIYG